MIGLLLAVVLAVGGPASVPAAVIGPSSHADPGVGSTVQITGVNGEKLAVTLTAVTDPAEPSQSGFAPSAGDRLIGVQFRIADDGPTVYQDAPASGVTMIDVNGQSYSPTFDDITAGPQFPVTVSIPPGDSRLGYVVFEVPDSAQASEVQYVPNSGTGTDVATWTVNQTAQPPAPSTAPADVVRAYYDAINARDFVRAWDLGGSNFATSYDEFVSGFDNTALDTLTIKSTEGDVVHIALDALQTDGSHRFFTGTYTVMGGVIVSADVHQS